MDCFWIWFTKTLGLCLFLHAAAIFRGSPAHLYSPRFSHSSLQIETHVDGERVRYFQDDDSTGLKEMVRREKMSSAQDQNALYSRMASKVGNNTNLLVKKQQIKMPLTLSCSPIEITTWHPCSYLIPSLATIQSILATLIFILET